ncbi:uncharacterized protein LOC143484645 [Brachyhypopomus gauderio]|uniref:uncharacterized protein LOC143484645 n=1 Tax=Brachyhypopomus gauderio TaxID=698409 RepID=UPI0040411D0D
MPRYTAARKKGKKKAKRRHASSPARRRDLQVPDEEMQQDPVCASLLRQAQAAAHESDAECFRLAAERVWSERRFAPTPAFPEEESNEPIVVGVGTFALTPPEYEFESEDSGEEESFPPSVCSDEESEGEASCPFPTSAAPQTSEGERVSPPSSVYSAPTVYYGEGEDFSPTPSVHSDSSEHPEAAEEGVSLPPSVHSESMVCYGEGEEDVSPPPSGRPNPANHHGAEVDVSPPPSIYSAPTEYYGEGEEDVSRPPSVCSSPSELGEEGESASGCSGATLHTGKEVPRSPSAGSSMDWSRCTTAEEPMSLGRSI